MRLLVLISALHAAFAADWPQFLGPQRNGSTPENVRADWNGDEPKTRWRFSVGSGFAGPVVAGNRVVVFHRRGDSEILQALEAETGRVFWASRAPTEYRDDFGFDEGPRATPCVDGDFVYSMGAEGLVRCVQLSDGKEVWSVDTKKVYKAPKGFFGMACSPVVHGSNVLLNIGGADGAGIVAFDKQTGALRWKGTRHEASYASPVITTNAGQAQAIFFTRQGLAAVNPDTGEVLAELPWRARMHASVNAATPLVVDGAVFASASYDTGAILARISNGQFEKVWSSDDALSSHYPTPVHSGGFLYGFHGRQEMGPSFRCVELKSGKVRWEEAGFGAGSVTLAGTNLVILRETGELVVAPASPARFKISGRAQILGSDTRAFPALSNGSFYARDKRMLVCVQLSEL